MFGAESVIPVMQQMDIVTDFVGKYGSKIRSYFGGAAAELSTVTTSDLNDFLGTVTAIANDSSGKSTIEAAYFEDGKKEVRAAFYFTTQDADRAVKNIAAHRLRIEAQQHETRQRVLMVFTQTDLQQLEKLSL